MREKIDEFHSNSPAQTEIFAAELGAGLLGGEVIELVGDVGAGKTSFVRGLARGAGSTDRVSSPTFTLSQIYKAPLVTIHHYDFYRVDDAEIMRNELEEVMQDDKAVIVLEWAGVIEDILPAEHVSIRFEVSGELSRNLVCQVPQKYRYMEIGR